MRDGNVLTSAGVSAGIDFAFGVVAEVAGADVARAIQLGIEYDPAPPFDAGHPDKASEEAGALMVERNRKAHDGMRRALEAIGVGIDDWKANVIRLPVKESYWFGREKGQTDGGEAYRKLVDSAINAAAGRGAYLVLDLHRFGAPAPEHAEFWRDAAARYKDHPAVIFELFNEPDTGTEQVDAFNARVGEAVRAAAPNKLVLFEPPALRNFTDFIPGWRTAWVADPRHPFVDVDAVVTDFDGVHTDDTAGLDELGRESVRVSRADGAGVARLRDAGIPVLILSAEANPVVSRRAEKLGVDCIQGLADKGAALREWAAARGIRLDRIAYLGNDRGDIPALDIVGWPLAVPDAAPDALERARHVLERHGGHGAVRELAELVLAARDAKRRAATSDRAPDPDAASVPESRELDPAHPTRLQREAIAAASATAP